MKIIENYYLKDHISMAVGGNARYFIEIVSLNDYKEAMRFIKEKNLSWCVIGGGTNVIPPDGVWDIVILHPKNKEVNYTETKQGIKITIGAGMKWDALVQESVSRGYSGIEMMAGIPGSAGASVIQNIGAYGGELSDVLAGVTVFDTQTNEEVFLSKKECKLGYRSSRFKTEDKGRYIVSEIEINLSKNNYPKIPEYKGVPEALAGNAKPSSKDIYDVIISIRSLKLPNPDSTPNSGSFFTNPIVENKLAKKLQDNYPNLPLWDIDKGNKKLSAGWLIETAGLKGRSFGPVLISPNHALILTNPNREATTKDLLIARDQIQKIVFEKFSVNLEMEPILL